MSYDICFKYRIGMTDKYIFDFDEKFNITYNVGNIIRKSSGYKNWNSSLDVCVLDLYKPFKKGLKELKKNIEKYRELEPSNGWGNCENVIKFYEWFFESLKEYTEDEMQYINIYVY